MSKKHLIIGGIAISLIGAGAIVLALVLSKEDPNIRRGKEMLSIDEYGTAAKEFKIYLKGHDDRDPTVRAMLVYATTKVNPIGKKALETLLLFHPTVCLIAENSWPEYMASEKREEVKKSIVKMRRILFEEGVDTKDAGELKDLLEELARFIFKESDEPLEKNVAAYVLARTGRKDAQKHLVERLKGTETSKVEMLLIRLGSAAAPIFQEVVNDPNNLGREKAISILSKVMIFEAAKSVFDAHPKARAVTLDNLPETLRVQATQDILNFLMVRGVTRLSVEQGIQLVQSEWVNNHELHTLFSRVGNNQEHGILVLSGVDGLKGNIFSRLFYFDKTVYKPLKIQLKGNLLQELLGSAPVIRVKAVDETSVELTRPEVIQVDVEEIQGRGKTTPGSRVAIRGHKGTVKSRDDIGLINVKLDKQVGGETELLVAANALKGVVKKSVSRPGYRIFMAHLKDDVLVIRDDLGRVTEEL